MDKNERVMQHRELVRRIAYHLRRRLPPNIQVEDLIQAGMVGLLEASKRYDQSRGVPFKIYAKNRIYGAMFDEVRKNDWAPRSACYKIRKITEAIKKIEYGGREAKHADIAKMLGIDLSEYYKMLQASKHIVLDFGDLGGDEMVSISPESSDPAVMLEKLKLKSFLAETIDSLPDRERLVILLYYDEELNMKDVGSVFGISESRVSQLHAKAIKSLQFKVRNWRDEEELEV